MPDYSDRKYTIGLATKEEAWGKGYPMESSYIYLRDHFFPLACVIYLRKLPGENRELESGLIDQIQKITTAARSPNEGMGASIIACVDAATVFETAEYVLDLAALR